jgi:hypothetical protein
MCLFIFPQDNHLSTEYDQATSIEHVFSDYYRNTQVISSYGKDHEEFKGMLHRALGRDGTLFPGF